MELLRHPELADRLAAAHALGTLRGGARRRFEALARHDPRLRALALIWQERIAAMTELQPQEGPSAEVWKRIQIELRRERAIAAAGAPDAKGGGWLSRWAWPGVALAGALATLAAVAINLQLGSRLQEREGALALAQAESAAAVQQNTQLVSQLGATPQIRYVAVLQDDSAKPAVLVTFDLRSSTLTLRRVGDFREGAERSLQLWALPASGGPRSLGVLGEGGEVRLTAEEQAVREVPALAISLEPKGGVPSERGPTGPVLFKGALLPTS
ncbi:anti-sigma factor [Ramlibacter solisilvae]|uniref:RNA polymerase subunit sigma-70 n=1 Tax=Ramlibacter tataouinensis TaxID=94132 RepID=A0A127JUV5_9BURK|nr:anti-sigma factor [Ramlibacter tataouinensis]AMO23721.1 RNA polymerase subunit sigma-70 [Ramlibacter tataouinensis]